MNILIVDDSKPILSMVSEMLTQLGHKPHTAINGKEALDYIQERKEVELVLLDWNMPVMDGLEFLIEKKNKGITGPAVFMMTTEKNPEKIQKAIENGAVDYIMKPFTADILESKLEMLSELMD